MPDPDPAQEAEALRGQLEAWNHQYYVLDQPTVPDAEYDRRMRRLLELEARRRDDEAYAEYEQDLEARISADVLRQSQSTGKSDLADDDWDDDWDDDADDDDDVEVVYVNE